MEFETSAPEYLKVQPKRQETYRPGYYNIEPKIALQFSPVSRLGISIRRTTTYGR